MHKLTNSDLNLKGYQEKAVEENTINKLITLLHLPNKLNYMSSK